MSFFSINTCYEYLGTLNKYDTPEVFRPLQYNIINHFGGDARTYLQWMDRYVATESHGEEVHGHPVQWHKFKYETNRDGFRQPNILINQTDLSNHQLAVILPDETYFIWPTISYEEKNLTNDNDFKQLTRNLSYTYFNLVGSNGVWNEQDYRITINKVQEYLLVTHEIKILMSDSCYSHPDAKFWIASVQMNNPIDPEAMTITLDIHFKTMFTSNK